MSMFTTFTKTKSALVIKIAVAVILLLAVGGEARAALPLTGLKLPSSPNSTVFQVYSCIQLADGVQVKGGANLQPVTHRNGCKFVAEERKSLKYTYECVNSTTLKISWKDECSLPSLPEMAQLTVAVDSDTPLANNLLLGSTDQTLAKFRLTNNNVESVIIKKLTLSFNLKSQATASVLQNIRIYDNETGNMLGMAAGIGNFVGAYGNAVINFNNCQIARNSTKVLMVKADFASYANSGTASSNAAVQVAILKDVSFEAGVQHPIQAVGFTSGKALGVLSFKFQARDGNAPLTTVTNGNRSQLTANQGHVRADEFVLYRVKLTAAWANDTPSGSSFPSFAQTIGKFVATNLANNGSYDATVKYINLQLSSTIVVSQPRALKVYKDSLATSALAVKNLSNFTATTNFVDSDFTDVYIASGSSKTFYATLDTIDARPLNALSVRVPAGGIVWRDGVTDGIIAMDFWLPLSFKTLVY